MVADGARSARAQARRTLRNYLLSKLHLRSNGTPYGASIASGVRAFYAAAGGATDERIGAQRGSEVIRICKEIARLAVPPAGHVTVQRPELSEHSATDVTGSSPARTLILGATGFIGLELTRRVIESGHRVRVLVRSPGKFPADLRNSRLECLRGDLTDAAALRSAMEGVDCVYHLARADVKSWSDYERYEIGVTREIAEAALATGVKRLIYTGTIDSYYSGGRGSTITEATPLDPAIERRNLYARAKAASERMLLRMHREQGLPLVIVRPGIVIGRGGNPMHWGVGRWWYGSVCQTWGDGRNPLPLVLVEDVAKGLIAAAEVPDILGDSFNLVADPSLTAQDYLDEMDRVGGIRIKRHATPILKFYLADTFKWAVKVITRHPDRRLPSYRDWASRRQTATFDCTRAKVRLGWKPISDREELIRAGIHRAYERVDEVAMKVDAPNSPDASVIVVSFNTRDLLRECLLTLRREADDVSYETIVVDNASRDGSADMVATEFPWVRLIRSETNLGFAAANNRAFEIARGALHRIVEFGRVSSPECSSSFNRTYGCQSARRSCRRQTRRTRRLLAALGPNVSFAPQQPAHDVGSCG